MHRVSVPTSMCEMNAVREAVRLHYDGDDIKNVNIMTMSTIADIVYSGYCKDWEFQHKPLVLMSRYNTGIRYDMFRAILFAIDHECSTLTIHILSHDDDERKLCDQLIRDYYNIAFRVGGAYDYDNIPDIANFFDLRDRPYIPRVFAKRMLHIKLNVIDIVTQCADE